MSSLQDLLKEVSSAAPKEFDAEDHAFGLVTRDEREEDELARAHYEPVERSALRRQGHAESDPKYAGRTISRAQLLDSDHSDIEASVAGSSAAGSDSDQVEEDENLPFGQVQSDTDESDEQEDELPPPMAIKRKAVSFETQPQDEPLDERKETENMVSNLRKAASADVEKGQHVRKQLTFWDSLLEMRIQLQKPLTLTNTLPEPQAMQQLDCDELDSARISIANLVQQLSHLRAQLAERNSTYSAPPSKRRKISTTEEIPSVESELADLAAQTSASTPFLELTIRKWSDKVNAASTASLKQKTKFNAQNSTIFKNTWLAIEGALQADEGRLMERTKTLRTGAEAVDGGEPTTVFDDSDFYQQLLKDVVEHQLLDPDDPSIRALQLAAQKKSKKVVDTKASKGRKLRYHVHEKLQNFMVPIPTASWSEQQTSELFRSLLGKGFEGHLQDGEVMDEVEAEAAEAEGGLDGLRILASRDPRVASKTDEWDSDNKVQLLDRLLLYKTSR